MRVSIREGVSAADRQAIEREVAGFRLLEELVRWGFANERPIIDVVVQDEYTHDVIVRWSDRLVLVFDAT
jgi:hypothetical protein